MPVQYYALDEEQMQKMIAEAQRGHHRSQMRLLRIFDNFLSKYIGLLFDAKYDLGNADTRAFIKLYVSDPIAAFALKSRKYSPAGLRAIRDTVEGIQYMVQRYGDREDIEQTVRMAFLETLRIYERRGEIPFSGYIYQYYKYILKRMVDEYLIDQNGRNTFPLIQDSMLDEQNDADDPLPGYAAPPTPFLEDMLASDLKPDELWVIGETCGPPFDILTVQERQLLVWRYVENRKASEISHMITEHTNTLRDHFVNIRKKLLEKVQEDLRLELIGG